MSYNWRGKYAPFGFYINRTLVITKRNRILFFVRLYIHLTLFSYRAKICKIVQRHSKPPPGAAQIDI